MDTHLVQGWIRIALMGALVAYVYSSDRRATRNAVMVADAYRLAGERASLAYERRERG